MNPRGRTEMGPRIVVMGLGQLRCSCSPVTVKLPGGSFRGRAASLKGDVSVPALSVFPSLSRNPSAVTGKEFLQRVETERNPHPHGPAAHLGSMHQLLWGHPGVYPGVLQGAAPDRSLHCSHHPQCRQLGGGGMLLGPRLHCSWG